MTNTPNPGDQAVEAVAVTKADIEAASDLISDQALCDCDICMDPDASFASTALSKASELALTALELG